MLKKVMTLISVLLVTSQTVMAFTIINQTELKKSLKLEEAKRPKEGAMPVAIGKGPHIIEVPPKSIRTIELSEPCPVLLLHTTTTTKKQDKTVTSTSTTCYEPYDYGNQKEKFITNDWGIVIHKPLTRKGVVSRDRFAEEFTRSQNLRNGYGVKILHPKFLVQTSVDQLPAELQ